MNKLPRGERERESWKKLKENLKPLSTSNVKLKGKKGETEDEGEIKEIIQDFWKGIIQKEAREDTEIKAIFSEKHDMIEEIITKEEVTRAIKKLKDRKAAGSNDVVAEFIKKKEEKI